MPMEFNPIKTMANTSSHATMSISFDVAFGTGLSSCWCLTYSFPLCFMSVLEIWFYDYMVLMRALSQGTHIFSSDFVGSFNIYRRRLCVCVVSCVVPVLFLSVNEMFQEYFVANLLFFVCDNKIVRERKIRTNFKEYDWNSLHLKTKQTCIGLHFEETKTIKY